MGRRVMSGAAGWPLWRARISRRASPGHSGREKGYDIETPAAVRETFTVQECENMPQRAPMKPAAAFFFGADFLLNSAVDFAFSPQHVPPHFVLAI